MHCRSVLLALMYSSLGEALLFSLLVFRLARNNYNMYNRTVIRADAELFEARCILAIYIPPLRTTLATTRRSSRTMYKRGWPRPMQLVTDSQSLRQVFPISLWSFED